MAISVMAGLPAVQAGYFSARPDDATLGERLASPDAKIRRLAAERVENLRLKAKRAYLPQLLALIGDPDPNAEGAALRAICVMGSPAKKAIPVLIEKFAHSPGRTANRTDCLRIFGGVLVLKPVTKALDDENHFIRIGALRTLQKLGHEAAPALPKLQALLAAPKARLNLARAEEPPRFDMVDLSGPVRAAIAAIEARPTLGERLLSPDRSIQFAAVNNVKAFSPDATIRYLDTLIQLLGDKDGTIRGLAGAALCDLGPRGEAAIPALIQAFAAPIGEEAAAHRNCVARYGARAVPHLTRALFGSNAIIRDASLDALEKLGPAAKLALPALQDFAQKPEPGLQSRAKQVIATITTPPTLKERVESTDEAIRWAAFREVRALTPAERAPYVPYYVDYLRRNEGINRFPDVARMLCGTGPAAKAAIPVLIRRFVETHKSAVEMYRDCIAGFGADAVPALIDALSDKKYLIRLRSIETLQRIGPPAQAAVPALSALAKHSSLQLDVSAYAYPPEIRAVKLAPAAKRAIAVISTRTSATKR